MTTSREAELAAIMRQDRVYMDQQAAKEAIGGIGKVELKPMQPAIPAAPKSRPRKRRSRAKAS
jgi:hypothetical protein